MKDNEKKYCPNCMTEVEHQYMKEFMYNCYICRNPVFESALLSREAMEEHLIRTRSSRSIFRSLNERKN